MDKEQLREGEMTNERNSPYRKITEVLNKPVQVFHNTFPWVPADAVTVVGVISTGIGIHLMEDSHRRNQYTKWKTIGSLGLVGFGALCDALDGKLARLERCEIENPEERLQHEKWGQAKDPVADSLIETVQTLESAYTGYRLGRKFWAIGALFNLVSSNIPRTTRALAAYFQKSVPESYNFPDPRFFGTSTGRKLPNYLATFIPPRLAPLQEVLHMGTALANSWVAGERVSEILRNPSQTDLNGQQAKFGGFRAALLGPQSIVNVAVAAASFMIAPRLKR